MQAVQQIMDNIYQYVNMPDMQQAERDGNIAQCLNTFFQGGAIGLYEGGWPWGHGYVADVWGPDWEKPKPGHVYVYNDTSYVGGRRTLYFEIISYPYYDVNSLPDGLLRELCGNYSDPLAKPDPLVIYHRYNDEKVPWAGDQTSLSTFMGRMLLLSKLRHIDYSNPVNLAEQWSNYLDRYQFDFNDLDYIYRNFPLVLQNPWLWLQSGSSLNSLMELVGSGVNLNNFSFVSGDNPLYNFLCSVWGAEQLYSLWEANFNQTDAWQLVRFGNDTFVPLPYLVSYTHVLDEMGVLSPFGGMDSDSEIYGTDSNWNLTRNGNASLYSYEFTLSSIFNSLANSTLISDCSNDSEWNATGQNVTLSTDGYSIIVNVTGKSSNTTTLSYRLNQPLNLSNYQSLLLWFNVNATRSNFTTLKITLYDQQGNWKTYSNWTYNTSQRWERLTLDLDEPDSKNGTFGNLTNITITATPNQNLNYSLSIDDVRVSSRILCECLWNTDWSYQLLNGTGNLTTTVYGYPYVYDYPYSLGLEWNLTNVNGSAKYVYNPRGNWSLDPEGFLTFMLYGFGTEQQNATLTLRLCTDQNNSFNYSLGKVDWYGWRKISVPLKLMNKTGSANLSRLDYLEFKLDSMSNGTGKLVVSDIRVEPAQWTKVEFVVPDTLNNADKDSYPFIDLYCWNGSKWLTVGRWDANDSSASVGYSVLWSNLTLLDGTNASKLFSNQSLCLYPVGNGSKNPYSGAAGAINYTTTNKNSAGFAVMLPPPAYGNRSSVKFKVEVHYNSTGDVINTSSYPLALLYFNSTFTNLSLTAKDCYDIWLDHTFLSNWTYDNWSVNSTHTSNGDILDVWTKYKGSNANYTWYTNLSNVVDVGCYPNVYLVVKITSYNKTDGSGTNKNQLGVEIYDNVSKAWKISSTYVTGNATNYTYVWQMNSSWDVGRVGFFFNYRSSGGQQEVKIDSVKLVTVQNSSQYQENQYPLYTGNGSSVLFLNLRTAAGAGKQLREFRVNGGNVTLLSAVLSSLGNWTVDSLNSTVFVAGGDSVTIQGSNHMYLNYTFSPLLNINYSNTFMDVVYTSSYSYDENISNLTLRVKVDNNWLNYTLPPNSEESQRFRIPLNGSNLGAICFEHSTNTSEDWFSIQSINVFHLTNITQYLQTAVGYWNQTSLSVPGYSPRFTQILNATELPASLSAWAYVNGSNSSSLTVEFFDENGTFLKSDTVSVNGSNWHPVCLVDFTQPENASTLKFIVAADKLDHAYLCPSILTSGGIYEGFNSLKGWTAIGNGTAENNSQGLTVTLNNGTLTLWTDVSELGFDFSSFDTIAAAYNISDNVNASIVFDWLLVDANGNQTDYQSYVNLSKDSACAVDSISKYYKTYAPIPFPFEDCVENFSYTNFDLNRIMLNFSGTGQANVSWVQTQYIPDWDFISVTDNITSTHLYVNWLTKSLVFGGVFNSSTMGKPNWVGLMHTFLEDVNLTTNPVLEVDFRTQNTSLKLGLEVLVYDELGFQWVWKHLPASDVIFEHPVYTPAFVNVPDYLRSKDGRLYTSLRAIRLYVNDTTGNYSGLGSMEVSSVWLHPACGAPLSFLVLDDFEADDLSRWQEEAGWLLPYTDLTQWSSNQIICGGNIAYGPPGWEDDSFQTGWYSGYNYSSNGDVLTWTPSNYPLNVYNITGGTSDTEVELSTYLNTRWFRQGDTQMRLGREDTTCWVYVPPYAYPVTVYVYKRSFVRFPLYIPENAIITNAWISLKSKTNETNSFPCAINLLDSGNFPEFTSDPWDWPTSGGAVGWTVQNTTADCWYNTSNISSLVQRFINTTGYYPGKYVGFRLMDNDTVGDWKTWYTYESDPQNAPKLYVSYTVPQNYYISKEINVDVGEYPCLVFRAKCNVDNSTIKVALGTPGDRYYYKTSFELNQNYRTFAVPISNGFNATSITVFYPEFQNVKVDIDYVGLLRSVSLEGTVMNSSLSVNGGFENGDFYNWTLSQCYGCTVESSGLVAEGVHAGKITCNGVGQWLSRTVPGDNIVKFSIYKPGSFNTSSKYFFQLYDAGSGKKIIFYLVDSFDTNVSLYGDSKNKAIPWSQKSGTYKDYYIDPHALYNLYWNNTDPTQVEIRFGVEANQSSSYMIIDGFGVWDRGSGLAPNNIAIDSSMPLDNHDSLKLSYSFPSESTDVCTYTFTIDRDFSQEKYFSLWVYRDSKKWNNTLDICLRCKDGSFGGWNMTMNWTQDWKKLVLPLDNFTYQSESVVSGQLEKIVISLKDQYGYVKEDDWILISGLLFGHQYNFTLTSESYSGNGAVRIQNPSGGWVKVFASGNETGTIPFTPDELLCFAAMPKGDTPWAVMVDLTLKDGSTATLVWYRGSRPIPSEYPYDYLTQIDSNPDNWNEYRLNLFDAVKNYAEQMGRGGFQSIDKVAFLVGPGEVVFDSVLVRNVPENLDTSPLSVLSSPVIFFYDEAYPCSCGVGGNDWSLVNKTFTTLEAGLKNMNISVVWADAQETRKLMSSYPRSLLVIAGSIVPDTICGREGYSVLENFVERGGTVLFLSDDYAPVSAVGREGYETLWLNGIGLEYLLDAKSPTTELFNYSSLKPLNITMDPTEMGGSLGALNRLNASGFAWLIPYLRYQNLWVETYYYNSSEQLGRGVCVRPQDSLGYVAEFPLSMVSEGNDTGVVVKFVSDHFINLWLDTSGSNFDDYERPLPGVSDEKFMDYYGEMKAGNWTFTTDIPSEEYYASADFSASWHVYLNTSLSSDRNDSITATYSVNPNSNISISEFPFFTATILTIGNYTRLKLEAEVSGQYYTLFDDNASDWRKYVWYLPNICAEGEFQGMRVTMYENCSDGAGNASVTLTNLGAYTVAVPEYGFPKSLNVDFQNSSLYDYLFSGDSDYPFMGFKFNDTKDSVYTITREYPQPYSFLDYPYLEFASSGTEGNYTVELWLQKKCSEQSYAWYLLDCFNGSDSGSSQRVMGYNLYAKFNAYYEQFKGVTADLKGWKLILKGNAQQNDSKNCLFTLKYIALTDYYTGWRIYPGGMNYSGGQGYGNGGGSGLGMEQGLGASENSSLSPSVSSVSSSSSSGQDSPAISESVKSSGVDVSEIVSKEDYCLSPSAWSVYNSSGGVEARIVSGEYVELWMRRAIADDWAMFRYDLGEGVNVSQTNFLDFKMRVRPEGGLRLVAYVEVSSGGGLVELGEYSADGVWISWRLDVLSLLAKAGVNNSLVTGLVFKLVCEGGSGRYDCYADLSYLKFSGFASWRGGLSTLFYNDGVYSVFHFESLRGATIIYSIPPDYRGFSLTFNANYFLEKTSCKGVNMFFYDFTQGSWVNVLTLDRMESWENVSVGVDGNFVRGYDGRFLVYLAPLYSEDIDVNLRLDSAEVVATTSTQNYLKQSGLLTMSLDGTSGSGGGSLPTDLDKVFDHLGGEAVWFGEDYYHSGSSVSDWLTGWSYRKPVRVNNSGSVNLYAFQVKLTLQGTNPSQVGYVDFGKIAPDGSDIRFTAADGLNPISFWIESWNNTNKTATVWIKCPLLGNNSVTVYYMYYGFKNAESLSNGEDTFLFFDDFSGDILNPGKWIVTGNVTVNNGVVTIGGGSVESRIESTYKYGNMTIVQCRAQVSDNWSTPTQITRNYSVDGSASDSELKTTPSFFGPTTYENYYTSSSMSLGYDGFYTFYPSHRTFVRFRLDIPVGSTISNAYISLKSSINESTSGNQSDMWLLNYYNCPDFSGGTPLQDMPTAGNPVYWTLPVTYQDNWYNTADISSLIQSYIGMANYQPGSCYAGFRIGEGTMVYPLKSWYQCDSNASNAPRLVVSYIPPLNQSTISAVVSLSDYSDPDPGDVITLGRVDGNTYPGKWVGVVRDYPPSSYYVNSTGWSADTDWHVFQVEWRGANSTRLWRDSSIYDGFLNYSNVPDGDNPLRVMHETNATQRSGTKLLVDYTFVRKYAQVEPTVSYDLEQLPPSVPPASSSYVPVDRLSGSEMVHLYWHMLANVSSIDDYYLEFRLRGDVGAVFENNVQGEANAKLDLYKEFMLSLRGVIDPPVNYTAGGDYRNVNMTVRLYVQYFYANNSAIPNGTILFNETTINYLDNNNWISYVLDVPSKAPAGASKWTPLIRTVGRPADSFCHLFLDDMKCPQTYQTSQQNTSANIAWVAGDGHGHVLNCSSTGSGDSTIWDQVLNIPFSPDLMFNFDINPINGGGGGGGGWWLGLKFRVQLYEFLTSYNVTLNVTSPTSYVGPMDVNLSFENGTCFKGSLFVMEDNATHVPFTVRNQTVLGDYVLNMSISILANVSAGETKQYKIFWSDYDNPLPDLVSPNLRVVNWTDNTQGKNVSVNCTATDANMSRMVLHYYDGSANCSKDMVLKSGFYVGNFSYSGSYQFWVEAFDNCSNPMRTWTYPGNPPVLNVNMSESEVYIRDSIPAGTDSVWLYYSDGAQKCLNSTEDSLTYGYRLDCVRGGWNQFLRLPYSDILEIFTLRYESLPSWQPMVLERIEGGGLGNSSYMLDNIKWGLYPRTVLDYSSQSAMNFYFSYDPSIPVVKIVSGRIISGGAALLNATCSDIPSQTLNETTAGIGRVEYTVSNSTSVVYNSTMVKQHADNNDTTYVYTDFWYDYFDSTTLPDGFYKLNVSAWDNSGNRADDTQYIIVYNSRPKVEFLNVYDNLSVGRVLSVLARTTDVFDVTNTSLTVTNIGTGNTTVYNMKEGYFQKQNIWTYNVLFNQSGRYTLSCNATDYFGVGSDVVRVNISVDASLPSVIINSPQPNEWVSGQYLLNVTAFDDNNISSVRWRVYVIANETTGRLEIPYGYSDVWNDTSSIGGGIYTAVWNTTSLNASESLIHRYVVVFKVSDNNTIPNTVYSNVTICVDNTVPYIIDGPSVVAQNNVEEGKNVEGFTKETNENGTVIYTKFVNASLTFAVSDERLMKYYDIEHNTSQANLEAYLGCLGMTILDEYENGSRFYSDCSVMSGSNGVFFVVENYTLVSGMHNLTLTVSDLAGNTNRSIRKVDIVVDQTAPIVIPILPRTGMWLKRVINANWILGSFMGALYWLDSLFDTETSIPDWSEGVLFGVYVDDLASPVLTNTIYLDLSNRLIHFGPMTPDYYPWIGMFNDFSERGALNRIVQAINNLSDSDADLLYSFLACSGYNDLGLMKFERLYSDKVFWYGVAFTPLDFLFNILSLSCLNPTTFTCKFTAWDKAGNEGYAYSTFGIIPYADRFFLQMQGSDNCFYGYASFDAYVKTIQQEIENAHQQGNGTSQGTSSSQGNGTSQGGAVQYVDMSVSTPLSNIIVNSSSLSSGSDTLNSQSCGVCGGGTGSVSGNETGWAPVENLATVEQALNYELSGDVSFLPWMKFNFRVFGAPRDISLNVKFGVAPCVRLFFDPLSFEEYGSKDDSVLLRATPDTWNTFTIPLYRMARSLGLFNGLNAPTNISTISVSAYGERKTWERRAVFDNFWVATPVPLVEDYAEKAALSRDNYYKVLNVTKESNFEVLKQDISEVFAASYMGDFEYLAAVLGNFTQHLFPSGEMAEFTGASVRVVSYNNSLNESVPLFVVYSFPEGLENVSLLAAYNYTNIPNLDLSREAVLNANITQLCQLLAQGGGVLKPYGLSDADLAYLPYGAASFVIVNDTVCIDRLSAKPCTIQTVLATIASIAERVWNQKCVAQVVEQEQEAQQIEALRAFINEEAYRVDTFNKLLAALQWVNYMHPYNWDRKSFDTLIDPNTSPYWLSYTYASWGNATGYELLSECLANITQMLDFGDYFGAPPVFITSGEYNRTADAAGEKCVLIYKALERNPSWNYLLGAVQGEVLCAVFNDTNVLNVAKEFGRRANSTLADVYVYLTEMAFMYTRPYNTEEIMNSPALDALGQLFSGATNIVDQIGSQVQNLIQYFTAVPFVNLVSTLNALFTQKFDQKCISLGIDNYVEWLAQQDEASLNDFGDNNTYDSGTISALDPGETLGESASNNSMPTNGYDVSSSSVPPSTGQVIQQNSLYSNVNAIWDAILTNPLTIYAYEYTKSDWRTPKQGQAVTPPNGPILYMGSRQSGGKLGFESSRFLYNIIKILQNTFQEREGSGSEFTRSLLAYYIGKQHRDLSKLASLYPNIGVDQALGVYIIDTTNTLVDPTTGIVFPIDDKEQPTGFWDFGITVQLSLVSYGDVDGGFIDEAFIIQNDPTTCLARKLWLQQVDSQGKPIITNDRLIRLGLGYYERTGETLHFQSCIDDKTGAIIRLPLWDMGFNPNTIEPGKSDYVIKLDQIYEDGRKFDTGKFDWSKAQPTFEKTGEAMIWGKIIPNGDKCILNLVRQNIDYLLPASTDVTDDPYSIWWTSSTQLGTFSDGTLHAKWNGGDLPSLLDNLMNAFGVNIGEQDMIRLYSKDYMRPSQGGQSLKIMKCISQMLDGMSIAWMAGMARKPISFDKVRSVLGQTFVEQYFKAYLENGRHINDKGLMEGSDRYALEMLQGSEICNVDPNGGTNRINPIFYSVDIDPSILDQTTHTGYSLPRGDMPLFKVPASEFKDQLPDSIKPDEKGYVLLGIDIPTSEEKGQPVVFIPIFTKDAPISHNNNPSDFTQRITDTKSPVPVVSIMQQFWNSIEKYAVYTYNGKEYKPLLKTEEPTTEKTNIYSDSEYTPTSFLEIFHMLGILENICALFATHTGASEDAKTRRETLSLAYFFSELRGVLVDEPKTCLELFKAFGGDKVLAELRKIKPIIPYSNMAQLGWFTLTGRTLEDVKNAFPECKKDIESLLQLCKSGENIIPTQVDLLTILLSYTGAQRAIGQKNIYLPIKVDTTDHTYKIGSAVFNINTEDLKLLDNVGVPTDEYGITFLAANYRQSPDLSFTQLKAKDEQLLLKVGGIQILNTVEPASIREVFGGRVAGVPKEKQNPQIFDNLLKFTEVSIPGSYMRGGEEIQRPYSSGYYSFVEWLMSEKMRLGEIFDIGKKEGMDKLNYMDLLIKGWGNERSTKILEQQKSLDNEYHTRLEDLWALYLHQRTRISPTERSSMDTFGTLYQILKGDITEEMGNQHAIDYVAEKFMWSNNPDVQIIGIKMKQMELRLLDPSFETFEARPETLGAGKGALALYLTQYKIYEGSEGPYIKNVPIIQGGAETGIDPVALEEGKMQLMAEIFYKGGSVKELQEMGFTKRDITLTLDRFETNILEGKTGEKMTWIQQWGIQHWADKQRFLLDPSTKTLGEMMKSGLILDGVSTVIGAAKMIPFLTIVAPILETIGYTAVAALESMTTAPTLKYNATSGEFYVGPGGAVSSFLGNPDWNLLAGIAMTVGVMLTSLMQFGAGPFKEIEFKIDMMSVNIILAGAQQAMMSLGMCYVPESTIADIMKPILGIVGVRLHPYIGAAFEIAGLLSMLPQVDQFYHERIWPIAKLALGASLMGTEQIIVGSIATAAAMTAIGAIENAWENQVFGDPWYQDIQIDFKPILANLPLETWGVQDYVNSWITKNLYGMWYM
ncbi:MAG: DUF2341 domain-containing protein [Candidatus Freyarchaeum deiterrae]